MQDGVTVSGLEKIRSAVNDLNLLGLSVDLSNGSVDAQPANGGVLVVVTGHYTPAAAQKQQQLSGQQQQQELKKKKKKTTKKPSTKPFVQTFYLTATSNVS